MSRTQAFTLAVLALGAGLAKGASPETAMVVMTIAKDVPGGSGGLEIDAMGTLYTADFGATLSRGPAGTKVFRVRQGGSFEVFADGLSGASGNTFDEQGNLLQSNVAGNTVSRIAPDGSVAPFATSDLRNPVGIVRGGDGSFYVANCGSNTIKRLTADGEVQPFSAAPLLRCPNGITLASDGNLYVSNFYDGAVVRVLPDGTAELVATLPGENNGHLVFGNGVLYVAARKANQIYEVTLGGEFRLIAGSGARGHDDGPALEATLSLPNDVALSADGRTLFFNEVGSLGPGDQVLTPTYVRSVSLAP